MSIFSEHVLKLLSDYKRMLKRYLSDAERKQMLISLGIKRKSLKFDTDVILYNKLQRVLNDIEYWNKRTNRTATEYSGVEKFYQYLKKYLSNYRLENNLVVHVTQRVSCALVQAIQIVSSSKTTVSDSNALKLNDCIQTVAKYGTKAQRLMLAKALHKQQADSNNANLYTPIVASLLKASANL